MSQVRHILVATDFSDCSKGAVDLAVDLAQNMHASLLLLHVWQITALTALGLEYSTADLITAIEDSARSDLAAELARVKVKLPDAKSELRSGIAWEEIGRAAKHHDVDLVVVGTHGRTGFKHFLMGSVAEHVVRTSPTAVLTVPPVKVPAKVPAKEPT